MELHITETVLRDANQSLIATRMKYQDFDDILETMDKAGYFSLECWGGATFDSCIRYLGEDPWERLRKIKSKVKNTKLQMLLRGQNILGYKHYPDDVVRKFIDQAVDAGIDIIRIFDALNDLRNIEVAVYETLKKGAHAQGTIVYTTSPIYNMETYARIGSDLEKMGVNSICIKDMAGIMSPSEAFELVSTLKSTVKIPVFLHTHCTTGLGPLTLMKAVEAGCDGIDTAISSFSGGTSQPATETMNYIFEKQGIKTGLDKQKLKEINDFFKPVKDKFIKSGTLNPFVLGTNTDALNYQIPGGMLSNLISQLKQQNALDRLEEVLAETPKVRKELGYPPLVTPMSQMVGTQAAMNVLSGERYKIILKEVKDYVKGEYGRAPGEIDQSIKEKVLGDDKPLECRFADTLEPAFEKNKAKIGDLARSDEDVMDYILFPQIAEKFLKNKYTKPEACEKRIVQYCVEALD